MTDYAFGRTYKLTFTNPTEIVVNSAQGGQQNLNDIQEAQKEGAVVSGISSVGVTSGVELVDAISDLQMTANISYSEGSTSGTSESTTITLTNPDVKLMRKVKAGTRIHLWVGYRDETSPNLVYSGDIIRKGVSYDGLERVFTFSCKSLGMAVRATSINYSSADKTKSLLYHAKAIAVLAGLPLENFSPEMEQTLLPSPISVQGETVMSALKRLAEMVAGEKGKVKVYSINNSIYFDSNGGESIKRIFNITPDSVKGVITELDDSTYNSNNKSVTSDGNRITMTLATLGIYPTDLVNLTNFSPSSLLDGRYSIGGLMYSFDYFGNAWEVKVELKRLNGVTS